MHYAPETRDWPAEPGCHRECLMKKRQNVAIPDFSTKRAAKGSGLSTPTAGTKTHQPDPRQPQKPPAKAKNGGRRGT